MKGNRRITDYSSPYVEIMEKRNCLKCNSPFLSSSPYNRICEKCGLENEKTSSMGFFVSISTAEIETEV